MNFFVGLSAAVFWVTAMAAYATHLFWAIGYLLNTPEPMIGKVAIAIVGALAPPLGMIHGVMIWMGV